MEMVSNGQYEIKHHWYSIASGRNQVTYSFGILFTEIDKLMKADDEKLIMNIEIRKCELFLTFSIRFLELNGYS